MLKPLIIVHAIAFTVVTSGIANSQPTAATQRFNEIARRVAAFTARMNYRDADQADKDRYFKEIDSLTAGIRDAVDEYIQTVVGSQDTASRIQDQLKTLLGRTPNPLYGDGPFVEIADLPAGRVLLVAYPIVRPPHHDVAFVRGYIARNGHFEFVAQTATDFAGYNMFKKALPSPIGGELWMMAWGQAEGGNGAIVRFRIYAFDGRTFRTEWAPDDMMNATIVFSGQTFAIDHDKRPESVHDEYLLTASGVLKM